MGAQIFRVAVTSSSTCHNKSVPTPCATVSYNFISAVSGAVTPNTGYATFRTAAGRWPRSQSVTCSRPSMAGLADSTDHPVVERDPFGFWAFWGTRRGRVTTREHRPVAHAPVASSRPGTYRLGRRFGVARRPPGHVNIGTTLEPEGTCRLESPAWGMTRASR